MLHAGYAGGFPSYGFASDPVTRPTIYNASGPGGKRWSSLLADSSIPRLYHSSLMLLRTGEVSLKLGGKPWHSWHPCSDLARCSCLQGSDCKLKLSALHTVFLTCVLNPKPEHTAGCFYCVLL